MIFTELGAFICSGSSNTFKRNQGPCKLAGVNKVLRDIAVWFNFLTRRTSAERCPPPSTNFRKRRKHYPLGSCYAEFTARDNSHNPHVSVAPFPRKLPLLHVHHPIPTCITLSYMHCSPHVHRTLPTCVTPPYLHCTSPLASHPTHVHRLL